MSETIKPHDIQTKRTVQTCQKIRHCVSLKTAVYRSIEYGFKHNNIQPGLHEGSICAIRNVAS
ncbi:hypothetical protein C0J52_01730 [Blattella germanica]|nr:hypothetical protein C0J52_01730 [Blattella germanica]